MPQDPAIPSPGVGLPVPPARLPAADDSVFPPPDLTPDLVRADMTQPLGSGSVLRGPRVGDIIGRYELKELIGEGGFGSVFVADQRFPVRRTVALKVLKPGADTDQVVARFEAERQALAMMEHPNIAKVLDAGSTDNGLPYFVMELVHGIPITEYCLKRKLDIPARLALFKMVCEAVQHAHQKGIIHRDIKPTNVLVGLVEGTAVPKVIDFGIAKMLHGRLTDKTIFTDRRQLMGTPQYMSPEQAEMSGLDIDTRSDIYSLGVLLYELLTGTTPLDPQKLRTATYGQMQRIIAELDPLKPSTQVLSKGGPAGTTHLSKLLRRELDWIVMRCLEKERSRRYATAHDLARDIERYLADEPVEASAPSTAYRLRRLAAKHRGAVRVAAAGLLLLVATTIFSVLQAVRATRAQTQARNEAAIAQAVNDFLKKDLLAQASPFNQSDASRAPDPGLRVRDALDNAAVRVGVAFASQPRMEVALRNVIGNAYREIGEYDQSRKQLEAAVKLAAAFGDSDPQALLSVDNLAQLERAQGRFANAEALFDRTIAARKKLLGEQHPDTLASMFGLARLYVDQARYREAEPLLAQVLRGRRSILGENHRDTLETVEALGGLFMTLARFAEAEPLLQQALDGSRQALGPSHPDTLQCLSALAMLYQLEGRFAKAEPLEEQAEEAARNSLGAAHPQTLRFLRNLGEFYEAEGNYSKAEPLIREALNGCRMALGINHADTLAAINALAMLYMAEARYRESEDLFKEGLERSRHLFGRQHPLTLSFLNNLGALYTIAGRFGEAEPMLREAMEGRREAFGARHPTALKSINNLANLFKDQERFSDAQPLYEQTLEASRAMFGSTHPQTLTFLNNLGVFYVAQNKFEKAEPFYLEALEGARKGLGEDHPETLRYLDNLGVLYVDERRYEEADKLYQRGLEASKKALGSRHPETLRFLNNIGVIRETQGRRREAESLYREALEGIRNSLGEINPEALSRVSNLLRLYKKDQRFADAAFLLRNEITACSRLLDETDKRMIWLRERLVELEDQGY